MASEIDIDRSIKEFVEVAVRRAEGKVDECAKGKPFPDASRQQRYVYANGLADPQIALVQILQRATRFERWIDDKPQCPACWLASEKKSALSGRLVAGAFCCPNCERRFKGAL